MVLVGIGGGPTRSTPRGSRCPSAPWPGYSTSRARRFADSIALLASGRLPIEDLLEPDDVPFDRVADLLPSLASGDIAGGCS
jgi:hypothetical protein